MESVNVYPTIRRCIINFAYLAFKKGFNIAINKHIIFLNTINFGYRKNHSFGIRFTCKVYSVFLFNFFVINVRIICSCSRYYSSFFIIYSREICCLDSFNCFIDTLGVFVSNNDRFKKIKNNGKVIDDDILIVDCSCNVCPVIAHLHHCTNTLAVRSWKVGKGTHIIPRLVCNSQKCSKIKLFEFGITALISKCTLCKR